MEQHDPKKNTIAYAALAAFVLISASALGSGSISTGTGGINQHASLYAHGKRVFFDKLACGRAECPIRRNEFDASLAESVVRSIQSPAGVPREESRYDAVLGALTSDEKQQVVYYLSRRFGLDN